jgi:hypothetical protein
MRPFSTHIHGKQNKARRGGLPAGGELYLTRALGGRPEGAKQAEGGNPRRLVASGGGGRASDDQIRWPETKAVWRLVLRWWGDGGRAASTGP